MDALPYTELDLLALNEKADALVPDVACCPILDPWLTVNAPLAGLISTSFAPAGFIVPVMLGQTQHHGHTQPSVSDVRRDRAERRIQ